MEAKSIMSITKRVSNFLKDNLAIIYFIVLTLVAVTVFPTFRTKANALSILRQAVIPVFGCVALNFILTTGNIDLSCGYLVGLVSITVGVMNRSGANPVLIVLVGLLIGAAVGAFNGGLMVVFHIPSFIATLGSGYICYGFAQIVAQSKSIRNMHPALLAFGKAEVLPGITLMMVYALLAVVLAHLLLTKTTFGKSLINIGLNQQAAYMSGQKTDLTMVMSFVICSALVAFSAIMSTIRVNTGQADMGGPNYTFTAVTACVLGGTSLYGGKTNIFGGFFAVFVILELETMLTIMGVNNYIYKALQGVIILVAIVVQTLKDRRAS